MVAIYHKSSTVLDVLFKHRPDVDTMAVGVCEQFHIMYIVCFCEPIMMF